MVESLNSSINGQSSLGAIQSTPSARGRSSAKQLDRASFNEMMTLATGADDWQSYFKQEQSPANDQENRPDANKSMEAIQVEQRVSKMAKSQRKSAMIQPDDQSRNPLMLPTMRASSGGHAQRRSRIIQSPRSNSEKLSASKKYTSELETFSMAIKLSKRDLTIDQEEKMTRLLNESKTPGLTASQFEGLKREMCKTAGVNFNKMHPEYAKLRQPKPLNQSYQLGSGLKAKIQGVETNGTMYTSLDRTAEGASNLHRREVGAHSWHTAGVCAAYAHSIDKNSLEQAKLAAFEGALSDAGVPKEERVEIIEKLTGEQKISIGSSNIEFGNTDALGTSFVRVFQVLEAMVPKQEGGEGGTTKKVLWQRIMAPDVMRQVSSKVGSRIGRGSELNGDNEKLMAHMELAILKTFNGKTVNGQKLDISFINTPINELAGKKLTGDKVLDGAGDDTKNKLMKEIIKGLEEKKISPDKRQKLTVLRELGTREDRFSRSIFIFVAAQALGYETMVGCKSAKDRTGFFNAIATLVLDELDNGASADEVMSVVEGKPDAKQWKKLIALTQPHMFDLPEFNQGLVGLKAGNALNKMWDCFSSQLKTDNPEESTRAKAYFLAMLTQGSGGADNLLSWIPSDDPDTPFQGDEVKGILNKLKSFADTNGLIGISDKEIDTILDKNPVFKERLQNLDGKKLPKEWIKGASYAGI